MLIMLFYLCGWPRKCNGHNPLNIFVHKSTATWTIAQREKCENPLANKNTPWSNLISSFGLHYTSMQMMPSQMTIVCTRGTTLLPIRHWTIFISLLLCSCILVSVLALHLMGSFKLLAKVRHFSASNVHLLDCI